jgi:hypothetical protein
MATIEKKDDKTKPNQVMALKSDRIFNERYDDKMQLCFVNMMIADRDAYETIKPILQRTGTELNKIFLFFIVIFLSCSRKRYRL